MKNKWQVTPIGEQIEFLTDYTANGSFAGLKQNVQYYNQPNYAALVRTTDLEKKVFSPQRFTDKKGYEYLKKSSLVGGEIVLANVGSIGKVYRVPKHDIPMTLAPNMYLIKFKKTVDEDFAFQYLSSKLFQKALLSNVASTTLSAINKSSLRRIAIPVPSLAEQQTIANILSSVDDAIQKTDQIIQKTEKLKQGLMSELLTKGIGHKKFKKTKLGEIPEEWKVVPIVTSDIQIIDGDRGTNYPKKNEFSDSGFYLFLSAKNFTDDRFDFTDTIFISEDKDKVLRKGKLERGDVVLTTRGTVGSVAIYDEAVPFDQIRINSGMLIFRPGVSFEPELLYYLLKSPSFKERYKQLGSGSAQPQLPIRSLKNLLIPVIPKYEQKAIVKQLESIDLKHLMEIKQLEKLKRLKQALMQDIFSQKVQIN